MFDADNDYMKKFSVLILCLFAASAFGEDTSKRAFPDARVKKQKTETMSTKAYRIAKEACVNSSNRELKGKKLTECIVNYQKEAK